MQRRRGFTLIELLISLLIIALLMMIGSPLYLSAVADAQRKSCRANMQSIANAVYASKVRLGLADFEGLIKKGVSTESLNDLPRVPLCPSGGAYTLKNGATGDATTFRVECSVAEHGAFEPGIDMK